MQPTTGSSTCEDGKNFLLRHGFWFDNANVLKQWKSSVRRPIKFFIFKNFVVYACFTFAFRLLLVDPDPGPRDLDSCNLILLLKVICILSHKTFAWALYPSDWRFLLRCPAAFWDKSCWQIRKRGFTTCLLRDGPLKTYGGGGEVQKKNRVRQN